MAKIRYNENRPADCAACGAKNVIRVAYAPGPAEDWYDVNCDACGAALGPREKQGLLIVEPAD